MKLTQNQIRAALAGCRRLEEKRHDILNSRMISTVVYGQAVQVELIPHDYWVAQIRVGSRCAAVKGATSAEALHNAIEQFGGKPAEQRKRGSKPGPRQPKDGSGKWEMRELDTMRILVEAIMPDIYVREAMKTIDGVSVVVTVIPGQVWTIRARVHGSRTKVLVAKGGTRQEALMALMLRNA